MMPGRNYYLLFFLLSNLAFNIDLCAQQGQKLLFINPLKNKAIVDWTKKQESFFVQSNCKIDISESNVEYLERKPDVQEYLKKYKYWIRKNISAYGSLMSISYELETKPAAGNDFDPMKKQGGKNIVLGVFTGSFNDDDEDDFKWWFEHSIAKYCKNLIEGKSIPETRIIHIGNMVDANKITSIENLPNRLYIEFLKYCPESPDKRNKIEFVMNYIVTVDLASPNGTGDTFINMDEGTDLSKGKVPLKIYKRNSSIEKFVIKIDNTVQMKKDICDAVDKFGKAILKLEIK